MRGVRVWARLLGVERTVVEGVDFDDDALVVAVRPGWRERGRCGLCRRRCPGYDVGEGRRRWRALDLGTTRCYLEAEAPRVECKRHGVVVAAVPWARHGSRFSRSFEDQVAWLACECSKRAVAELMRIAWLSVGRILTRVAAEKRVCFDPLDHLVRIGIDELSHRKGQRYLTVVVDHDSGLLVWAAPGRDKKTLRRFFDLLGEERCARIELVSADGAGWIEQVVSECCPQAAICLDPFHVVQWASAALDEVRREVWNAARRAGQTAEARALKGARFALWKNPQDLSGRQQATLAEIAQTNEPLYRAYLLKEQLGRVRLWSGRGRSPDLLAYQRSRGRLTAAAQPHRFGELARSAAVAAGQALRARGLRAALRVTAGAAGQRRAEAAEREQGERDQRLGRERRLARRGL